MSAYDAEEVAKGAAAARLEGLVEHGDGPHAVDAEVAEVDAEVAPGDERPLAAPEVEAEGVDGAHGFGAVFAAIAEPDEPLGVAGGVELVEQALVLGWVGELWREEQDAVDGTAAVEWQDGFDFGEGGSGVAAHLLAAPGAHHACAEKERGELGRVELQGGEVEVGAKGVADAGLALDGGAVGLEVGDVAVEGAEGDAEAIGQLRPGEKATGAQERDDAKEAVSAAHVAAMLLPWCGVGDLV